MADECHVAFLPATIFSHMIPMVEIAVLMASRGVKTTIITTKPFADRFSDSIDQTIHYDHQITLHIYEPKAAAEFGTCNILDFISSPQETVDQFLLQSQPNCIIADAFYTWTTKLAAKFNIPRITFDPAGFFPKCVGEMIRLYQPPKNLSLDSDEPFTVPHLPHEIAFTRKEMPPNSAEQLPEFALKFESESLEAELTSYGGLVNTFYELEPEYVRHYREVRKKRAWHIGPVSLFCKNVVFAQQKLEMTPGEKLSVTDIAWLDSKTPNSVVYVGFGTMAAVESSQLYEIALGLEASNYDFIWVIKKDEETWLPHGFEERMREKGKGVIIKGWAPQALILDHVSVGGFITHCGWNSMLEGVSGGVAMLTWPVAWEQLYTAKLVTDVLKIGVSIGQGKWSMTPTLQGMGRDAIRKGIERIMSPEEGEDMRRRAQILKENAKAAVEEGGSSDLDLIAFIAEMKANKSQPSKSAPCDQIDQH